MVLDAAAVVLVTAFGPFVCECASRAREAIVTLLCDGTTLMSMADIFSVIADPTRRDILLILLEKYTSEQEISVSEIVTQLETSQPTVSKHLKVLREAELVSVREDGQHRFYALNPEPLELVEDFVIPFLSADFDTEVSFEYVTEDGSVFDEEVLSDNVSQAAASIGRAAAQAEHQVRELVARFRYRS